MYLCAQIDINHYQPCMNLSKFLATTPLWLLILLVLAYMALVGYFVYIGIRLFREK